MVSSPGLAPRAYRRLAVTDFLGLVRVVFGVRVACPGFKAEGIAFMGNELNRAVSQPTVSVIVIVVVESTAALRTYATRGYRLRGDMNFVGPRPPRESDILLYDSRAHRQLFVKPAMSGLLHVGGQPNLFSEDSIQLGLDHVEDWSMAGDVVIFWRALMVLLAISYERRNHYSSCGVRCWSAASFRADRISC